MLKLYNFPLTKEKVIYYEDFNEKKWLYMPLKFLPNI